MPSANGMFDYGMVLILPEHSQRPYRYGMTLLCVGAMFNWLGLADNNAEPVRYIGVTLIAAGAMLICLAMCFWMKATHDPQVAALQAEQDNMPHIVTIHPNDSVLEKPPDYETVTGALPPSYEDAIKLSPAQLQLQLDLDSTDSSGSKPVDTESAAVHQTGTAAAAAACSTTPESCSTECEVHKPADVMDNFGAKVLRISRKFLRRTRSVSDVESDTHTTEVVVR